MILSSDPDFKPKRCRTCKTDLNTSHHHVGLCSWCKKPKARWAVSKHEELIRVLNGLTSAVAELKTDFDAIMERQVSEQYRGVKIRNKGRSKGRQSAFAKIANRRRIYPE